MKNQAHPIIVVKRRKAKSHGAAHGSWKIAYADFMTAMMAFFLVMWLISISSPKELIQIAEYFRYAVRNHAQVLGAGEHVGGGYQHRQSAQGRFFPEVVVSLVEEMVVYPVEHFFLLPGQVPVGIGELGGYPGVEFSGLPLVFQEQHFGYEGHEAVLYIVLSRAEMLFYLPLGTELRLEGEDLVPVAVQVFPHDRIGLVPEHVTQLPISYVRSGVSGVVEIESPVPQLLIAHRQGG